MSLNGAREGGWDPFEDAVRAAVMALEPPTLPRLPDATEPPTVPELGPLDDVEGRR